MMGAFADNLTQWAKDTEARTLAVYRLSVELLGEEMSTTPAGGGKVPIQTGNLARSVLASTDGMPKTSDAPSTGSNVGAVTATLRIDQPVWLGYQAKYARRVNSGFVGADKLGRVYNQSGAHFVEYAIEMWPTIVRLAAEHTEAQVKARKK